jgi:uncharacterized protein
MKPARLLPALCASSLLVAGPAAAAGAGARPSFNCARVEAHSVPALVCRDAGLAALDRTLAKVYAEAVRKTPDQQPATLRKNQRAWIRERDACGHQHEARACVDAAYRHRIVELQARYALVEAIGPVHYACEGENAGEVVATYYRTDPPSLIAEREGAQALMLVAPSGSGAKYESAQGSLWEHQGEALVRWGAGGDELHCVKQQQEQAPARP